LRRDSVSSFVRTILKTAWLAISRKFIIFDIAAKSPATIGALTDSGPNRSRLALEGANE
jgi:hypothetical protein